MRGKNKLLIGLTGGIGSGKSTVANYFKELGIDIIDADVIAHQIVQPGTSALKKLIEHFGKDFLDTTGELNRAKLRDLVFADKNARLWLEQLLHPLILQQIDQQTQQTKSPYVIAVIPLLIEKNIKVDRILVIDTTPELQIQRIKQRSNLSDEQIASILKSQVSREGRLAKANDVIHNENDLTELKKQVIALHEIYRRLVNANSKND